MVLAIGLQPDPPEIPAASDLVGTLQGVRPAVMINKTPKLCHQCPCRTPLRATPESIQRAAELDFDPPLDEGIKRAVHTLVAAGVETFESCQGGDGHAFPEPTVRFEGNNSEGLRAISAALAYGLPVARLRRAWGVIDGMLHGPWWEMTFDPPRHER
jgi:hypothetical protein